MVNQLDIKLFNTMHNRAYEKSLSTLAILHHHARRGCGLPSIKKRQRTPPFPGAQWTGQQFPYSGCKEPVSLQVSKTGRSLTVSTKRDVDPDSSVRVVWKSDESYLSSRSLRIFSAAGVFVNDVSSAHLWRHSRRHGFGKIVETTEIYKSLYV